MLVSLRQDDNIERPESRDLSEVSSYLPDTVFDTSPVPITMHLRRTISSSTPNGSTDFAVHAEQQTF